MPSDPSSWIQLNGTVDFTLGGGPLTIVINLEFFP